MKLVTVLPPLGCAKVLRAENLPRYRCMQFIAQKWVFAPSEAPAEGWGGEGDLGKHAVERTGVNVAEMLRGVKGVECK